MEIIPGILEKDWAEIERKIELVKPFSRTIHIDIIDGKFALASPTGGPNITFLDPAPFTKYTKDIFFELHMMVENPIQYLNSWASVGFKRFLGHIEKMPDQAEFVAQAQLLGEVGLAIDGPTDLTAVKVSYRDLDSILIMTIKAGASGQEFNPEYLKKVEMLKQVQDDIKIEVDGGINDKTIPLAKQAGATRFVSTSFLFNSPDAQSQFNLLKNSLAAGQG